MNWEVRFLDDGIAEQVDVGHEVKNQNHRILSTMQTKNIKQWGIGLWMKRRPDKAAMGLFFWLTVPARWRHCCPPSLAASSGKAGRPYRGQLAGGGAGHCENRLTELIGEPTEAPWGGVGKAP